MLDKPAPDFSLFDQKDTLRSLKDYAGRWVVLYFYPHDNSINCTREACAFRDEYQIISQFGNAEVIGVNQGPVASHKKFAEKNKLNFPVLSDPGHKVTSAYGAWRSGPTKLYDKAFGTRRNTYIIDTKGIIVKCYSAINSKHHAQQIITDLQALQGLSVSPV